MSAISNGLSLKDVFFCGTVAPRRAVLLVLRLVLAPPVPFPVGAIVVLALVVLLVLPCAWVDREPVLFFRVGCLLIRNLIPFYSFND